MPHSKVMSTQKKIKAMLGSMEVSGQVQFKTQGPEKN